MTREQNFRVSLKNQLNLFTAWIYIEGGELKRIPASSFPSFMVSLGATRYTAYTFTGAPTFGEQDFRIEINYRQDHLKGNLAYLTRSDDVKLAEQFFTSVYAPPILALGETYRIELAIITGIKPANIDSKDTRYSFVIEGKYFFTLL